MIGQLLLARREMKRRREGKGREGKGRVNKRGEGNKFSVSGRMTSVTHSQWCRAVDCSRASDRQQRTHGCQQSDDDWQITEISTTSGQSNMAKAVSNASNVPILYNGHFSTLRVSILVKEIGVANWPAGPNTMRSYTNVSSVPEQDVNPFSHFSTAHPRDKQPDWYTTLRDHRSQYAALCCTCEPQSLCHCLYG